MRFRKDFSLVTPHCPLVRCAAVGGGIVLPLYGERHILRGGDPPTLAGELLDLVTTQGVHAVAGRVDVRQFIREYTEHRYPHKLNGLAALYEKVSGSKSPHDAMRYVLNVGCGEAVIGYVSALSVYKTCLALWGTSRKRYEYNNLFASCAGYALAQNPDVVKLRSDRCTGTDSRCDIAATPPMRKAADGTN